jgi:hypothetical protein
VASDQGGDEPQRARDYGRLCARAGRLLLNPFIPIQKSKLTRRRANEVRLFFGLVSDGLGPILRPSEPSHFLMALIGRNDFTKAPALHYIAQSKNTTTQEKTKEKPPSWFKKTTN